MKPVRLQKCLLKNKSNMTFELKAYLKRKQDIINTYLPKVFEDLDSERELIKAISHSLMAGGKRLRPILCMAAARLFSEEDAIALPASCAIEMIHTYSLIHDDLPAMDDDDLRRGVLTCHKKFSEATAILAGDALLTHAFYILANPESIFETYPDEATRLKLVGIISSAAGTNGMVEGQMMDMQGDSEDGSDPLQRLKQLHALKTGRMIRVSIEAGAVSANAPKEDIEKLVRYADNIGLAFQVADDILNIEGNPEIMGKASGSDQLNDKMTFPAIIGLEDSKMYAKELIGLALEEISGFDRYATSPLRHIANYIIHRDH